MILDTATPMLQSLYMLSPNFALDGLNYASVKLQRQIQHNARRYGMSRYGFSMRGGHRSLLSSDRANEGVRGRYYSRFSHSDGKQLHGLDEFVKFRVYNKSLKSVVGFIDTKSFNAEIYKDGKVVSKKHVKGQAGTKEIGERMEKGGRQELSEKQRKLFYRSGWVKASKRGYIQREARPVVQPAYNSLKGEIASMIEAKYSAALKKHLANNFKARKIA